MTVDELSRELLELLKEGGRITDALHDRLAHGRETNPLATVSLLESLALVDERRGHVLDQLRKEVSSRRRREAERSIRQFLLRALDRIRSPQTTGFLEDYLYATELVEAKSRGMGALRRDEYRAWDRLRNRPRLAYIVPCLDAIGRSVPRWVSRSDWPLSDRFVVAGAEELWALGRVGALGDAHQESREHAEALFGPLVERYARESLTDEVVDSLGGQDGGVLRLVSTARELARALEPAVRRAQRDLAERFAQLDEEQRFWGVRRQGAGARPSDEGRRDADR